RACARLWPDAGRTTLRPDWASCVRCSYFCLFQRRRCLRSQSPLSLVLWSESLLVPPPRLLCRGILLPLLVRLSLLPSLFVPHRDRNLSLLRCCCLRPTARNGTRD